MVEKRRRGRPRMEEREYVKECRVGFRCSKDDYNLVNRFCENHDISKSELFSLAINEYFDKHWGDGEEV